MSRKVLSAAVLASILGWSPALADLRGPAEIPPASFKGQQYVDSRGCVFLRAGHAGRTTWVPRVSRDRKQLCGFPASGKPVEVASARDVTAQPAAPTAAVAPAARAPAAVPPVAAVAPRAAPPRGVTEPARPVRASTPAPVFAPVPMPAAAAAPAPASLPAPQPAQRRAVAAADLSAGPGLRIACPPEAPIAERFDVHGGGSKVLCTRGDGNLQTTTLPRATGSLAGLASGHDAWEAASARAAREAKTNVQSSEAPRRVAHAPSASRVSVVEERVARSTAKLPPDQAPPGWKPAWDDGRLNPNRGKQTVAGVLEQDQIWTRTAPSELREDWPRAKAPLRVVVRRADGTTQAGEVIGVDAEGRRRVRILEGDVVSRSSKGTVPAAAEAAGGRHYVQVGTFGVAANAEGSARKLAAMGLPVARSRIKGGSMTVVSAGPFASMDEARAALGKARAAGFGDAVLRR